MHRIQSPGRVLSFDLLRIAAIFAMMMLHVAGSHWAEWPVTSGAWQVLNIYDSLVRWCVPILVMISGVFMLNPDRQMDIRKLFTKNILRMVTAYLFWATLYAIYTTCPNYDVISRQSIVALLRQICTGHYHLWFLFMIVGLYLITPFLRKLCESKQLMRYFLLLWFLFSMVRRVLGCIPQLEVTLSTMISNAQVHFVIGYSGYFILGYYLYRFPPKALVRRLIYLLGILGVLFTMIGTSALSRSAGTATVVLYIDMMPNILLTAIAVFLFFQTVVGKRAFSEKASRRIAMVSSCTFGMYLVHAFFISALDPYLFRLPVPLAVPLCTALVFVLSFLVMCVVRLIPGLRRYIM